MAPFLDITINDISLAQRLYCEQKQTFKVKLCSKKRRRLSPILTLQGKKFVSIVPKPESEEATAPNMFKSLAGGLKSDKKCRKVRDGMQSWIRLCQ